MGAVNAAMSSTRKRHPVGGTDLGKDRGMEAKRLAAAILEVLAGVRTPTEAASALGLSVPRYYQVEAQALRGLLTACEPKPRGRVRSVETEAKALHKENQRLQRELTRHQTLAVQALEPGHAGRPAHTPTPAEEQVLALEQQLQDKEVELRTAKAREEIALVLPEVRQEPLQPEKKTPPRRTQRRRRGRKKNT